MYDVLLNIDGGCPTGGMRCDIACSQQTAQQMCNNDPLCCTDDTQCASNEKCCPPSCGCYNQCTNVTNTDD